MKLVKNEKLEKSMVELQFSVDAETFRAAVDKAYKREGKKYNVPGFRKGKAPRAMIEKMYGADIFHYDAINDLFPENYEAAVKEAGLEVVGQPEVDVVSMSMDEGVVLKAVVPVKPEVTVGEYTGLKVTRKVTAVEDADVEAEITRMQERNGRMITREGKAENGDTADIDFEGFVDGVAFEGGKGEHYSLVLGSNSFIPGFEEQVVGHEAGEEFDVNVTFPEQYHAAELAGKPAVFKIKLHEVKYKELPALDDEFAKDVSEYDTLDELRASIRKEMEERNAKQADVQVENDLVDQVIATLEGEIPEAMYESRMDDMVRDFEYRLSQQGLKLEMYLQYMGQTLETFRASYKEQAEKQVKIRLALEAIAAKEKLEASDEVSEYDTLDELRASIRKEMEERNAKQADVQVENDLVDQVIATLEGEIPEAMYESRMDDMVRDFEYRLSQQGLKLEMYLQYMGQTLETFRASYKEQAEKQVKIRLALEAIAAKEKLEASDEDFNAEVKRIADQYKMEEDKVRELVDEKAVKADLAVNKAIDFIKEKAEITTEEVKKDAPAAE